MVEATEAKKRPVQERVKHGIRLIEDSFGVRYAENQFASLLKDLLQWPLGRVHYAYQAIRKEWKHTSRLPAYPDWVRHGQGWVAPTETDACERCNGYGIRSDWYVVTIRNAYEGQDIHYRFPKPCECPKGFNHSEPDWEQMYRQWPAEQIEIEEIRGDYPTWEHTLHGRALPEGKTGREKFKNVFGKLIKRLETRQQEMDSGISTETALEMTMKSVGVPEDGIDF